MMFFSSGMVLFLLGFGFYFGFVVCLLKIGLVKFEIFDILFRFRAGRRRSVTTGGSMPHKQEICTTMYGLAPTTTRENRCIIDRVIKLKIFAIHWFSLKFLVFYNREKEPHSYCHKLWLAAFGRQNALQAKKRDIFPAGKVWFLPPRPSLPLAFYMDQKNWIVKIFSFSE